MTGIQNSQLKNWQTSELQKCSRDIVYFAENYLHTAVGDAKLKLSNRQAAILRRASIHPKYLAKACRQFGKSTLIIILAIHSLLFGNDERIIVVSAKQHQAQWLSDACNAQLELLPLWLGRLVERRGRVTRRYGNNTLNFTSTGPALCGITPTVLLVDDLAFFDEHFWLSIWPVVASGRNSRIKIFSTPKDRDDVVTKIYEAANAGLNDFVTDLVTWEDTKYWTEARIKDVRSNLGEDIFKKEFECQV